MTAPLDDEAPSILLIGASGRSGHAIMNKLMHHPQRPDVHLLCSKGTKLSRQHREQCASIHEGDARRATDILQALKTTDADTIILSVDDDGEMQADDIRTTCAWAVVSAMKMPGMEHVRAVVFSTISAGSPSFNIRMGYLRLIRYRLRRVIKDSTEQEMAFLKCGLSERTVFVRPTSLNDYKPSGKITKFGEKEQSSLITLAVGDVGFNVAREVCESEVRGKILNDTGTQ